MVLEKTLESPLDYKEIQPSILKGISPGCSLEGLMLKLKVQYFGHLRADSFEKTLMLGKIEGRRIRGRQRMRQNLGPAYSQDDAVSVTSEHSQPIFKDEVVSCVMDSPRPFASTDNVTSYTLI